MIRFLTGALVGAILGPAAMAAATVIIRDPGYLNGWTVLIDGDPVCHDPFVWPDTHEIECD